MHTDEVLKSKYGSTMLRVYTHIQIYLVLRWKFGPNKCASHIKNVCTKLIEADGV